MNPAPAPDRPLNQTEEGAGSALLWSEQFTGIGYDNVWSEGETVTVVDGTLMTLDEDASADGAFTTASGRVLEVTSTDDGTGIAQAYVRHNTLALNRKTTTFLDGFLVSQSFSNGEQRAFMRLDRAAASPILNLNWRRNGSGDLVISADIRHNGSVNNVETLITVGTPYAMRFIWDLDALSYDWLINGISRDSGVITGAPAASPDDWRLAQVSLGIRDQINDILGAYQLDNLLITTP